MGKGVLRGYGPGPGAVHEVNATWIWRGGVGMSVGIAQGEGEDIVSGMLIFYIFFLSDTHNKRSAAMLPHWPENAPVEPGGI